MMTRSKVPLFLAVFLLSLSGILAAEAEPVFSSSATSVQAGQSVTLKCQLVNFDPGNEAYSVAFYADEGYFGFYDISAPDSTGDRKIIFHNQNRTSTSLGRHPLPSAFPIFEVSITPTRTAGYSCYLGQNSPLLAVYSKRHSITVTPPTPSVRLTSNLPSVPAGQSVNLICQLVNFDPGNEVYSVAFYADEGYFGFYDISAPDSTGYRKIIFHNQNRTSTTLGRHPLPSTFPIFEVAITPNRTGAYSCYLGQNSPLLAVYSRRHSITVNSVNSAH